MRGNKSGIAFGQRNQKGQSDTTLLISIANYIRERWHMDFKREWYVGFEQEQNYLCRIAEEVGRNESRKFIWKNPDLLCIDRKYGLIIIELDGAVHDRKIRKTQERNKLFTGAGIKLIVLNISDIKESGKTIKEACECEMLKLIGHGQC